MAALLFITGRCSLLTMQLISKTSAPFLSFSALRHLPFKLSGTIIIQYCPLLILFFPRCVSPELCNDLCLSTSILTFSINQTQENSFKSLCPSPLETYLLCLPNPPSRNK